MSCASIVRSLSRTRGSPSIAAIRRLVGPSFAAFATSACMSETFAASESSDERLIEGNGQGQEHSERQALAKTVGVSLATMSGIVDRLETQGMAERSLDPNDQRVRRASASELGRQTVQRLMAARPELSSTPLGLLAIDDLRALAQGIRALVRAVESSQNTTDHTTMSD